MFLLIAEALCDFANVISHNRSLQKFCAFNFVLLRLT